MCYLSLLTLDVFSLLSVAAPVGPTPTVLPMGAPVPRPRGPPPPPGDENREVRLQGSSWEQESVLEEDSREDGRTSGGGAGWWRGSIFT